MRRCCTAVRLLSVCVLGLSLLSAAPKKEKKKGAKPTPGATATATTTTPTVDPKNFVIGAEDIILVQIWRDAEVSRQVMVRPDGKITLQLLGEVQAAGLTPEGLAQVIYDGLTKLKTIDRSEVTVTVVTVNSRKYYIQGEVNRTGPFTLLVPTTVLEALGNAGGFKEFANRSKIVVIHSNGTRANFNYKEVIAGKKMQQNILVQPGDQIIVR